MPNPYLGINTPYTTDRTMGDINSPYEEDDNVLDSTSIPLQSELENQMDDSYEDYPMQDFSEGNIFGDMLGGANVFSSQSIAESLMDKYDMEGLTAGMFPALSKELVQASQASTYDAYKQMLGNPLRKDYRREVSQTAGLLNPNKKRERALGMFQAGMSDINAQIFSKTSMARGEMRNWLSNALAKVKRMKY